MRRALPLLLLLAACGGAAKPSSRVVFDCSAASYKPSRVLVACGDGGFVLEKLHFSSWTDTRAVATGVVSANDCVPYCAKGTFHSYPAELVFSKPLKRKGYTILSNVDITYPKGGPMGRHTESDTLTELEP